VKFLKKCVRIEFFEHLYSLNCSYSNYEARKKLSDNPHGKGTTVGGDIAGSAGCERCVVTEA
jgi:hypothetical protein